MNKYLNTDEAADYLRMKKSTLYSYVHQRRIPFRKHGRRLIFCMADLDDFSSAHQVEVLVRPGLPF